MSGHLHPPGTPPGVPPLPVATPSPGSMPSSAASSPGSASSSGSASSPGAASSSGAATSTGSPSRGSGSSSGADGSGPPAPLLTPAQAAALLDQVVYEQVLECVDLDALYHVAQSLDSMVGEIDGVPDDGVEQVCQAILDRALCRLPDDLRAYLRVSDWAARDDCLLCEVEARQAARSRGCVTATGGERRSKRPHS
jgi:hypothetical protein